MSALFFFLALACGVLAAISFLGNALGDSTRPDLVDYRWTVILLIAALASLVLAIQQLH